MWESLLWVAVAAVVAVVVAIAFFYFVAFGAMGVGVLKFTRALFSDSDKKKALPEVKATTKKRPRRPRRRDGDNA